MGRAAVAAAAGMGLHPCEAVMGGAGAAPASSGMVAAVGHSKAAVAADAAVAAEVVRCAAAGAAVAGVGRTGQAAVPPSCSEARVRERRPQQTPAAALDALPGALYGSQPPLSRWRAAWLHQSGSKMRCTEGSDQSVLQPYTF